MKKKLLNSMRVLLVAAGLGVGASAWANEVYDFETWADNGYTITTGSSYNSIAGSSYADYVSNGTFTYSFNNRLVIRFKDSNSRDLWNLRSGYGLYCYRGQTIAFTNLKAGDKIKLTMSGTITFNSGSLSLDGEELVENTSTFVTDMEYDVTADCNVHFTGSQSAKITKLTIIPTSAKVEAPTLSISSMTSTGKGFYNPVISINSSEATSYGATFTPIGGSEGSVTISDGKFTFTKAGTLSVYGIAAGSANSEVSKVYLAAGVYTFDNTNSVDLSDENLVDCSTWTTKTRDWANWGSINSYTFYNVPETTSFPGMTLNNVTNSSYCPGVGLYYTDNSGGGRSATMTGASSGQISETVRYSAAALTPTNSIVNVVKTSYVYSIPKKVAIKSFNLYTPNTLGAVDKSSAFTQSDAYTLKKGETKVFTFTNHGYGTDGNSEAKSWYNWTIGAYDGETSKAFTRADFWDNIKGASTGYDQAMSTDGGSSKTWLDWDKFKEDMADATVVATLSYSVDGTYSISAVQTGHVNNYIYYVDHSVNDLTADELTIKLGVEYSWSEILSVENTAIGGKIASSGYSSLGSAYGLDFAHATGLTAAYAVTDITKPEFGIRLLRK